MVGRTSHVMIRRQRRLAGLHLASGPSQCLKAIGALGCFSCFVEY